MLHFDAGKELTTLTARYLLSRGILFKASSAELHFNMGLFHTGSDHIILGRKMKNVDIGRSYYMFMSS